MCLLLSRHHITARSLGCNKRQIRDATRDAGLRIDHLLLSKEAARRLVAASVDRSVRGVDNASDHAPVWIELKDVNRSSPRKWGASPDSRLRENERNVPASNRRQNKTRIRRRPRQRVSPNPGHSHGQLVCRGYRQPRSSPTTVTSSKSRSGQRTTSMSSACCGPATRSTRRARSSMPRSSGGRASRYPPGHPGAAALALIFSRTGSATVRRRGVYLHGGMLSSVSIWRSNHRGPHKRSAFRPL